MARSCRRPPRRGKVGNVFIVNRLTGKLLHKSEPFVKQSANIFTAPSRQPVTRYPGINGGSLWSPPAYLAAHPQFLCHGRQPGLYRDHLPLPQNSAGHAAVGQQVGGTQRRASRRINPPSRHPDRHQRQHRQDRLAVQVRPAHVWRRAGDRQRPGLRRRDERRFDAFDAGHGDRNCGAAIWASASARRPSPIASRACSMSRWARRAATIPPAC